MRKDKVGFRLLKITTEQFAVIENSFDEKANIQLGIEFEFGVDDEHRILASLVRFELLTNNKPFLLIHVRCDFDIEEDAWADFLCEEEKSVCFPKGFVGHIAMLTVGTARGVLHAKTENTKYNQFFLPAINITNFVKEDVTFELKKDMKM